MLPPSYQICFQQQLKKAEYLTLVILVFLLQAHKQVTIELLATLMPYPIMFESRRRSVQRFLKLPCLKVETLWFPLVKYILRIHFKNKQELKVAVDRTQWRDKNIFFISLIWDKRDIPLFWNILPKKGSSNIFEQQNLIRLILRLLKDYQIVILGDREFGHVKLAHWLSQKNVKSVLRVKQERYIKEEEAEFKRLSELGLIPGTRFYLRKVQFTKQKGFGQFDLAGYWQRKYRGHGEKEGWYLLTNLGNLKESVAAFKCRSGIKAMFKDCKTGGYNLERTQVSGHRLESLILLITLAYSCAILQGRLLKNQGLQKYVGRVTEPRRTTRRHSSFWIGLYGQSWGGAMDYCRELVEELMKSRRNKLPFFHKGLRAMSLILSIT